MIDAVFFVVLDRFKKKEEAYPGWQCFYCGASLAMYLSWMVATVIGIAIGASLPDLIQHGLDYPMIAVFAAMLASTLVNWKVWATVTCAGVIALLFVGLPSALVVPAMLVPTGTTLDTCLENPYLLGSLVVFVLFFLTRRMLLSSFIGVLVFFAAQWFFGGV